MTRRNRARLQLNMLRGRSLILSTGSYRSHIGSRCLAHLDLSITSANRKAWLWVNRRSVEHAPILQRKAGRVMRTYDAVSHKFAF